MYMQLPQFLHNEKKGLFRLESKIPHFRLAVKFPTNLKTGPHEQSPGSQKAVRSYFNSTVEHSGSFNT